MKSLFLSFAAAVALFLASSQVTFAQNVDEEVTEQITRQISDSISRRVSGSLTQDPAAETETAEIGSNTAWFTGDYSRIENDGGADFNVDVFGVLGGVDRDFDGIIGGVSLGYTRAEIDTIGTESSSDSFTVSPYAAYQFNDNIFANALVGYTFADAEDADSDIFFSEVAANAVVQVEKVDLLGKAGYRFSVTDTDGTDEALSTHAIVLSGQAGYLVSDKAKPFVRAQYEYSFPEEGDESDSLFLGGGISVDITPTINFSLSGEAEVLDEDINTYGGTVAITIAF